MNSGNDPLRKVSASLIVGGDVYGGVNEIPGIDEDNPIWQNREAVRVLATHAEVDAIRSAIASGVVDFSDAVLFVTIHPCKQCLRLIRAIGVTHVFYNEEYIPLEGTVNVNTNPVTLSKLSK